MEPRVRNTAKDWRVGVMAKMEGRCVERGVIIHCICLCQTTKSLLREIHETWSVEPWSLKERDPDEYRVRMFNSWKPHPPWHQLLILGIHVPLCGIPGIQFVSHCLGICQGPWFWWNCSLRTKSTLTFSICEQQSLGTERMRKTGKLHPSFHPVRFSLAVCSMCWQRRMDSRGSDHVRSYYLSSM